MSTRRLKRLGIRPEILDRLNKQNILTCKDLLTKPLLELLRVLGVSHQSIQDILITASKAAAPQHTTALSLYSGRQKSQAFLPTSLNDLDKVLQGGLHSGSITEVAGPSGCGKTQTCVMLCLQATLPVDKGGLSGNVLYIDTESAFSAERLVEMAENRYPDIYCSEEKLVDLMTQVHVTVVSTSAALLKRLESLEEEIISKKIKLIIIDSIASLVRKEYDTRTTKNIVNRTNLLAKEAAILKYIAESFSIPVVTTNQITTRYARISTDKDDDDTVTAEAGNTGYVTAALGNTWSHSVNTRLIVQYLDNHRRQILIAKSPVAPFAAFTYTIDNSGLKLEEDSGDCYEGTDPGLQKIRVRTALSFPYI